MIVMNHSPNLTVDQLAEMRKLASKVIPQSGTPLRGQEEIAKILRDRGCSLREISRFLGEHGLPVSPATLSRHIRKPSNEARKNEKNR